jgi:hypothetical protein
MNVLVLDLYHYDSQCFYYLDSQKNALMDGLFTKIIYTHSYFTMNGLFFFFPIQHSYIEPMKDKYYVHFDPNLTQNKAIMDILFKLETQILLHYASFVNRRKASNMTMYKHLLKGKLRIHEPSPVSSLDVSQYILKISGIWETDTEFGVTYKWLEAKTML